MNKMKKVLALVMVCLMVASLMPVSAFAEHEPEWAARRLDEGTDDERLEHYCKNGDCNVESGADHETHEPDWSNEDGFCVKCGLECTHDACSIVDTNQHQCDICGKVFDHDYDPADGKCNYCEQYHDHTGNWNVATGECNVCSYVCEHDTHTTAGKCTVCGKEGMGHTYVDGACEVCTKTCDHPKASLTDKNCGYHHCGVCQSDVEHTVSNGKCTVCGATVAEHTHTAEGTCSVCELESPHDYKLVEGDYENHKCSIAGCDAVEEHDSLGTDGACSVCGQSKKPTSYTEYELRDGTKVELNVTLGSVQTVNQGSSNLGGLSTASEEVSFELDDLDVAELIKHASALGAVFENQSDVAINITTKVQPGDAALNANGEVEYLPFTVTPSIEIKGKTINGSDVNDFLVGEVEVVLPVGTLTKISGIRHISDTMSEETLECDHAEAKQTVTFNVTHFSEFDVLTDPAENVIVASCGTVLFTDLQSALDYASVNSGTVKLLTDVIEADKTYIVADSTKTVILDLNNHTIETSGTVLDVFSKNFTLTDNSNSQGQVNSTNGNALYINSGATANVTKGLVHNDGGSAAAVYVSSEANFNVKGGKICAVTDFAIENYGTVTVDASDAIVVSEANSAINNGGTLTVKSGNINYDGTSAMNPDADINDIAGSGTTKVSGGSFGHPVLDTQCADDYMPTPNQQTAPFTVTPMSQVKAAKLVVSNGIPVYYDTLQAAINAVTVDGTVESGKIIPTSKSVVTLLRDVAENIVIDKGDISSGFLINANGFSIQRSSDGQLAAGAIDVRAGSVELCGFNQAGNINVEGGATAYITSGVYGVHGGAGRYVISGSNTIDWPSALPSFKDQVKPNECYENWRIDIDDTKKNVTFVDSYTLYVPAVDLNTVPGEARFTVVLFQPVITNLSNNYVYYKSSTQFSPDKLVIYTNGDYSDVVRKTEDGVFKCLRIGSTVYDQNANSGSTVYYTVAPDSNGKAVITINSNGIKKWFASTGTKDISVLFTTGETNTMSVTVGSTVKTGDESNIALWAGIMAASLIIVGCGAYIVIRKSKKKS